MGGAVPVHMCLSAAIIRQLNELLSKAEQEAAVMQERRPPASEAYLRMKHSIHSLSSQCDHIIIIIFSQDQ